MTDIQILKALIKPNVLVPLIENNGKFSVNLVEKQANTAINIVHLPEESVVFKADAFTSPDNVFNGGRGECKRADYVIVSASEKKRVIIYIELANNKQANEIIQQLKGAKCFVAYCREIGKQFFQQKDFLENFSDRFAGILKVKLNKQKTRIERKSDKNNTAENFIRISNPNRIEFNLLAGGK